METSIKFSEMPKLDSITADTLIPVVGTGEDGQPANFSIKGSTLLAFVGELATPVGSANQRPFQEWLSQLERRTTYDFRPVPVMTNPPVTSLVKSQGVSGVSVVNGGAGYKVGDNLTVDGGEFGVAARLRVTSVDGDGKILAVAVQLTGTYITKPVNPVSTTDDSTGTGATFNLTWNPGVGSTIYNGKTWNRTDETLFKYLGYNIKDTSSGYRGNGIGNGTQCVIEFFCDADAIDFRFIGGNAQYDLYVDGQRISDKPIQTDSSGAPYIYNVTWPTSVPRHYKLMGINTGFGGIITAQQYTVWHPGPRRRPLIWQMGDSYTYGTGATQISFNDLKVMADILGFDSIADGIGGKGWTSTDSTIPQQRVADKLAILNDTPEYVFLSLGYNDAAAGRLEVLETNFRATIAKLNEVVPNAKVVVIGPATPMGSTSKITDIRASLIKLSAEFNLMFVDVDNWVSAANAKLYTLSDNTHPNDAGYIYRGVRLAQALASRI
ncbi:putative SGNH/GDSL hydrolase family protein [Erwinia phage vB_EamM_RisingSun]|uniref:Putative SGNH/GDSL hydrolase family protein n=1 Tax=Erwinia phage vB_EamM_RisingSun TaxID=2026080 RepID=A0A223LH35_9CAUD|nr:head decoration [Erwinia phage vB_EamM_RisingSun]ASU03534.1 putative SGNH/GDSL hydrolase family protein [Erwinia phage vB_EamM_RisingSun]